MQTMKIITQGRKCLKLMLVKISLISATSASGENLYFVVVLEQQISILACLSMLTD